MDLKGKKVLVVGLARTGLALIKFLKSQGAQVYVSEMKEAQELAAEHKYLTNEGIIAEFGGHSVPFFLQAELIVVSPGVPLNLEPLRRAQEKGIPVLSEIEIAFQFLKKPLLAVTGTNGKTTTTTLIGQICQAAGKKVFVGGNIGTPLIAFVCGPQQEEWVIAEISSFQLEGIREFRPHIAVLLNISEDHLDRYANFQDYILAKKKIFQNQRQEDFAVLNADDPLTFQFAHQVKAEVFLFSAQRSVPVGCFLEKGALIYQGADGQKERFSLANLKLKGAHNLENIMAAITATKICGCPAGAIQQVLNEFSGLEHRLEWVGEIKGVKFFNDSKGTNVGAVIKSLMSFQEPIMLIAGGKDKGGDYAPLRELIARKVKGLALIGEAQERMYSAWGKLTDTACFNTLEEAVLWSFSKAAPGDVVLLSPACSSFDMFKNYQERGQRFKEIVGRLIQQFKDGG
ncbi:MAG: UDP-N-acetylmuramoyl-L-alanine--D-glutamate ligase [bacterium]